MPSFSKKWSFFLIYLVFKIYSVQTQVYECPNDWLHFEVKCYRFVLYPVLDHNGARAQCGADGASLVGINTYAEHMFINGWLLTNDLSRGEFYTSGLIRNLEEGDLIWESDGSRVSPDLYFWLSEEDKNEVGQFITYKYGVTQYGWSRALTNTPLPFICEIKQEEAYRITEINRDFDYGLNTSDLNEVSRGPKFIEEPTNILVVEGMDKVVIDCAAFANPSPQYKMFKTMTSTGQTVLISPDQDPRYALTNGLLTIANPTEGRDAGLYFCHATNPKGTVTSHHGLISFGYSYVHFVFHVCAALGQFSNVQREKVRVTEHHSGLIDCMPPAHRPAGAFGWMKYSLGNFLRTDLNLHLFVSYNGKLYFTEVSSADAAVYYCTVKLRTDPGTIMGDLSPPARVSMAIELEVTNSMPANWGPEISNDFIAVFPRQPMRGQRLRLECLAFGTMPIHYSWRRERLPLPLNTELSENNRVLEIPDAQQEDSGVYICRASRGTTAASGAHQEKSFNLNIQALPYFIYELRDQHVDEGRQLTWRCAARGLPSPTYTWLKNGEELSSIEGDVQISGNVLTIIAPNAERHDGMYQCRASNTHGVSYSTGQLRVLGFKPTFVKWPIQSTTMGALGGTVTIICSPEAAPKPTITWLKNGGSVGSPDVDARIRVLSNGNLVISQLTMSDAGRYTCRAENSYGMDSSDGELEILAQTTISNRPANTQVIVNTTAFLACHVSHDPALDVEIAWFFQGRQLNSWDRHYLKGTAGGITGLYIQGAQKQHSGAYSCRAKTAFDTVSANATLTVRGPPGEPAGVLIEEREGAGARTVTLFWSDGETWGGAITHYTIQASTNFNDTWFVLMDNIPQSSTIVTGRDKRQTAITDLRPWTVYRFRIRARNSYGNGPYSLPTRPHQTIKAPPIRPPLNITSGEGKVGDLNISWVPIPPEEQGGAEFGYHVYHRLHSRPGDNWIKNTVGDVRAFVHLVGMEFFYIQYDVMVQPFNEIGPGPNSTVVTIYSAEDLPIGTPANVIIERYNATALTVHWNPVEDSRAVARGKILGYQVNYWQDVSNIQIFSHYTGQPADHATVIGLLADTWYIMEVQVYNSAGLGPRSEKFRQRTWKSEIKTQPTEIMVSSHGPQSVYVTWRGVSVKPQEETLVSYVMQYWPSTDNIRTAKGIYTGHQSYGVIFGLQKNVLYKLRVYPYSRGGDGGASPDRLFTLGGQIRFDPVTTEIMASVDKPKFCFLLLILSLAASLV